ncbi:MAG: hypothetical protein RSE00_02025 [Clostridia bacterium]
MKLKLVFISVFCTLALIGFRGSCKGISSDFKFVVDTIGIPQFNVYGDEINEDVYNSYNVFVYSNPKDMYKVTSSQRFKLELNNGKWTQEGLPFNGTGTRGEYYYLGTSYSGSLIENVYFPVDAVPETTPDYWNYISFGGAYESWFDETKYKYEEQLEFMKSKNMLFDELDFVNQTSNSYNLVEYNISPNGIGLDRANLNTCSTWKTMGIISTKRINNKGQIRNAIFATKPMAAEADVKACIKTVPNITIKEEEKEVDLAVLFGTNAINLNEYAKSKHVKEIAAVLYIDGREIAKVSDTKKLEVDKNINFKIHRSDYDTPQKYPLHLKVVSYLYTEFSVDGLMKDEIEFDVIVNIESKKEVPVKDVYLKVLQKDNQKYLVSPLIKTNITQNANAEGVVEAGRNLAILLNLEEKINKEDISVFLNNQKVETSEVYSEELLKVLEVKIPSDIKNTLTSWNYLRDKTKNYFDIDFKNIGIRVNIPNELKIQVNSIENKYEKIILFDSIDDFEINMNYIFNNSVINKEELKSKVKLEEWAVCKI